MFNTAVDASVVDSAADPIQRYQVCKAMARGYAGLSLQAFSTVLPIIKISG